MRLSSFNRLVLIGMMWVCQLPLVAQKTEELLKMDLEDIMNMDVTVFSVRGLTQRQTPGVLTVITEEEIVQSGARDLMDVLHRVPGFEFGIDQQSVISLGVRGNWAQEGKVLLMIDGMEMNEILFSCLALGDHFPLEHIQRIEIIRGAGTSFYGNYAELSVINIVTKSAVQLNGLESFWTYGRTNRAESRHAITLNFGKKIGDLKIKALSYGSRSLRSDRDYTDIYGNHYSMKSHSDIHPLVLNVGLEYRKLKANVLLDRYFFNQQDAYVEIREKPIDVSFNALAARFTYDVRLNDQLTLTPGFSYLRQEPWKSASQAALESDFYYFNTAERIKANLILRGNVSENVQVISGTEFFVDKAKVSDETPVEQYFYGGKKRVQYQQGSAFAQVFYSKGSTIPSVGLRYDRHNQFGAEFLPWVGMTQIVGKWSLKCLVGQTFRAPSIENMNISPSIKPEKNTTAELEVGYQVHDNLYFILDYYRASIQGPIIYSLDPSTENELYRNYKNVGSHGLEFESKYKGNWGYFNLRYSFYRTLHTIEDYRVEGYPELFLGFPAHKISLDSHFKITQDFSINPSFVFASKRFGYGTADQDANFVLSEFKPKLLADLYFQYSNVLDAKWNIGFGVYNILNAEYPYLQPYNSGHAPLPNLSREYVIRLKYRWNW